MGGVSQGKGFKALRTLYRKRMQCHVDSLLAGRIVSSVHKVKKVHAYAQALQDENVLFLTTNGADENAPARQQGAVSYKQPRRQMENVAILGRRSAI